MPTKSVETPQRPDLSALIAEMPLWVSRKHPRFREFTGYSPRSMANMDSLGLTKSIKKVKIAGAIHYERQSLGTWTEDHSTVVE